MPINDIFLNGDLYLSTDMKREITAIEEMLQAGRNESQGRQSDRVLQLSLGMSLRPESKLQG